jgi:hypothetical protein
MVSDLTTPVLVLPELVFAAFRKEQLAKNSADIKKAKKSVLAVNLIPDMCRPSVLKFAS